MGRTIVVGAGITGLYVARELARDRGTEVLVLERRARPGGRLKTVYGRDGQVLYEAGAWRVHSTHGRVRSLLGAYGIGERDGRGADGRRRQGIPAPPGSFRDHMLDGDGYVAACDAEFRTGYPGLQDGGAATYQHRGDGHYAVVDGGFSRLVQALRDDLVKNLGVEVRTGCRVEDVVRREDGYTVHTDREGLGADEVVCCVPPRDARAWTVFRDQPCVRTVGTRPLCHIYARGPPPKEAYALHPRLGQVIAGDFDPDWFQVSYSSGRLAQAWGEAAEARDFPDRVRRALGRDDVRHIRAHYWPHAVHYWHVRPTGQRERWLEKCVAPHPVRLPGLWICGEALSDVQGWCEGALQSAQVVLRRRRMTFDGFMVPRPGKHMVQDGRVLGIEAWVQAHPGGAQAIRDHLFPRDATPIFRRIGHSDRAWAKVLELVLGYVR